MNEKKDTDTVTKEIQSKQETKSFPLPWDRFWARCIDLLIHYLILILIYSILILFGISSYLSELSPNSKIVIIIAWAIISAVFIIYEFVFLSIFGATIGKALFRIKVKGKDGRNLSVSRALKRVLYVFYFGHYLFVLQEIFLIAYFFLGVILKKRVHLNGIKHATAFGLHPTDWTKYVRVVDRNPSPGKREKGSCHEAPKKFCRRPQTPDYRRTAQWRQYASPTHTPL